MPYLSLGFACSSKSLVNYGIDPGLGFAEILLMKTPSESYNVVGSQSKSCLLCSSQIHCSLLGAMTTLDDKLLGEKLQYYYSTSEDEDSDHEDKDRGRGAPASSSMPAEAELAGEGISINTGTEGSELWKWAGKVAFEVYIC